MGAWGADTFDNDAAADWAAFFSDDGDLDGLQDAFDEVFEEDYVDADVGSEALAAGEVIARLFGRWGKRTPYSEGIDKWVEQHPQVPPRELVDTALKAIDRITGKGSELAELWSDDPEWAASVADLRKRIVG